MNKSNMLNILKAGAIMTTLASSAIAANVGSTTGFTPEQTIAIEHIVHDYLLNKPEILREAFEVLQKKQQQTQKEQAKNAITQHSKELLNEHLTVAGTPKGTVTMIEFFDYQCGHCKMMRKVMTNLVEKNHNLRVIYKEFPIFGETSEDASRVAIAAAMQGKYIQVHDALLQSEKHLDKKSALKIAKNAGVNLPKLITDMNSKAVTEALATVKKQAEQLSLQGTPAFIVLTTTPEGTLSAASQTTFIPGGASEKTLQALINTAAGK